MFFLFAFGSPYEGEASGGLDDLVGTCDNLEEAKNFVPEPWSSTWLDRQILDGSTGESFYMDCGGKWHKR